MHVTHLPSQSLATILSLELQAPGDLPSLSFAVPAAAGVAGVVLSFVLSPFELVKVRPNLHSSQDLLLAGNSQLPSPAFSCSLRFACEVTSR